MLQGRVAYEYMQTLAERRDDAPVWPKVWNERVRSNEGAERQIDAAAVHKRIKRHERFEKCLIKKS